MRLSYCQEKALRLARHPEHVSSAQSRDDDNEQYPGAVRVGDLILSPSGMPWELDESLGLISGIYLLDLDIGDAFNIAKLSGNTKFSSAYDILFAFCQAGAAAAFGAEE
jgi:hypothetical protein